MFFISLASRLIYSYRLFRREYGYYTWPLVLLTFLSFASSLLEAIGINSIIPLFAFVNKNSGRGTDAVSRLVENLFNFLHITYSLRSLLIFIVILFIIKAILLFINTEISARIITGYERATRRTLFSYTLQANWPHLSKQKIGFLEQVLTTDIMNSSILLSLISTTIISVANLIIYIFLSFNISFPIAFLTFGLGVAVFFFFKPFFYRNRKLSQRIEELTKNIAHFVNENMIGIKTIKAAAVEKQVQDVAENYFEKIKELNLRMNRVRNITNTLIQPIGIIFIVGIFSFFYKVLTFNFASFAVIIYSINKVFSYIQLVQAQLHGMGSQLPYVMSIQRYRAQAEDNQEIDIGVNRFNFKKEIEFFDVSFSHNNQAPTLRHINFVIKKGEMVGLIGPSGSGKTTVVDLFLRLYNPSSGKILIDGKDINSIMLPEWRRHIGYVAQDMFLMNDTIENNVRFHNELTGADIFEAARQGNIDQFINSLPNKFSTIVGERGTLLSGGERQRIVLARVLARRPEILILDEATSALDNESESFIQKAIETLHGKVTVLIIAHRLSTVRAVDQLLVLESGQLIERGTPQELLEDKDSYFFNAYNIKDKI